MTSSATVPSIPTPDDASKPSAAPSMPVPSVLIPPLSFALVSTGVYRSGCPMPLNFPFLAKLHLKSIIYLADQDLPSDLHRFVTEHGIQVFHFRVQQVKDDIVNGADNSATTTNTLNEEDYTNGINVQDAAILNGSSGERRGNSDVELEEEKQKKKEKEKHHKEKVENDPESMRLALELLLDNRNFPVLIHSNKGKHRSGVLVALMRKLLQNWAFGSVKIEYYHFAGEKGKADVEFIEKFDPTLEYDERWAPCWLRYSPGEGRVLKVTKDG